MIAGGLAPVGSAWAGDQPAFVASIQPGDCQEVTPASASTSTAIATPEAGAPGAPPTYSFALSVEATLDDLVAAPHALVVEAVAGEVAAPIACGDIAGPATEGRLVTPIVDVETGALAGIALTHQVGANTVAVEVYIATAGGDGSPGADDAEDDGTERDAPDDGEPEGGV